MLTKQQKQFIKNNYQDMTYKEIAKQIGCSFHQVKYYRENNLPPKNKQWTKEEEQILKENYAEYGGQGIEENFSINRTAKQIRSKAKELQLKFKDAPQPFTEEDDKLIKKQIEKGLAPFEIQALHFPERPSGSIARYTLRQGYREKKINRKDFTEDDIEIIKNNYGKKTYREIQAMLENHHSIGSITQKCRDLDIINKYNSPRYAKERIENLKKSPNI